TDFDRLNDESKSICGSYSPREGKSCKLQVDCTAFNSNFKYPKFCFKAYSTIYNKNTLEKFKTTDKISLLQQEGSKLVEKFRTDIILKDPSRLAGFFILSFADLKNYNYYYWFGFSSPLMSVLKSMNPVVKLKDTPEEESRMQEAYQDIDTWIINKLDPPQFEFGRNYSLINRGEIKSLQTMTLYIRSELQSIYVYNINNCSRLLFCRLFLDY
uniref:Ubiquitin-like modifier-activating enzyme Atg7 N-terminal domain-containing protein n=1 Tax=Glossina palpalis gambiensis TaxID=67801 RepID=A0A1B0BU60_9MUSC